MIFFVAEGRISIFRKICSLSKEDIYIGGDSDNAIPIFDFKHLIEHFPNKYERDKYSESRITHILKNYLSTMKDAEYTHEKYIAKKDGRNTKSVIHPEIFTNEIQKYKFLLEKLRSMLNESEAYSENEWQKSIVEFILLLMPKYMTVLEKVKINDYYSKKQKTVKRECDLMLIDFNGYVDLIEIKKPFSNCLVQKNTYRDNYIPKRDISGSAVQLEKYSFHLSKWGHEGEKELSKVYAKQLPSDIRIKIANPKGIIIIGRSDLSECQILDFEIIRRQYSNIIDIITYDDLVHRLENTISILTHRQQG